LETYVETAARWHDLGKLHEENQAVLSGAKRAAKLPRKHWDAGSALLREEHQWAAWAVYAHHAGYRDLSDESNREENAFREEAEIGETNRLLERYTALHQRLTGFTAQTREERLPRGDCAVFLRLVLSCLADADHSDTAWHRRQYPIEESAPCLHPKERLAQLDRYVSALAAEGDARSALRGELYAACRDAEVETPLSACDGPVGTGKTTAVMAHLLAQARKRGLRRIFVVLPFTNIITQSAEIYRKALVLPGENPKEIVAELHHRADFESEEARHLSALWRAPIIVTTAVAFFETLASNRPSALRRLHELPGSAVFVDESHAALPAKLLPVAWRWMTLFADEWGCYWCLASGSLCRFWQIPEIARDRERHVPEIVNDGLRGRLSTYETARVSYRAELTPQSSDALAERIWACPGPRLVIFNTVQNAAAMAAALSKRFGREKVEHLSTALTPTDRTKTLERAFRRLASPEDAEWVLCATSCVEAGVNLSFRSGLREMGTLASLLQTAGRVNRDGQYANADVWSFALAQETGFNANPGVKMAAEVLRGYFERGAGISPDLSTDAVRRELKLRGVTSVYEALLKHERNLCFRRVADNFHVIEEDSCLALVDADFARRVKAGEVDWRQLQDNSVRIRRHVLEKMRVPLLMDGVYLWDNGYDGFLGYMEGVLHLDTVSRYIL
jgi:hypothetical protein